MNVPLKLDEIKNLIIIPLTGARIFQKKTFTDLGPRNIYQPLDEQDEIDFESVNDDGNLMKINKNK